MNPHITIENIEKWVEAQPEDFACFSRVPTTCLVAKFIRSLPGVISSSVGKGAHHIYFESPNSSGWILTVEEQPQWLLDLICRFDEYTSVDDYIIGEGSARRVPKTYIQRIIREVKEKYFPPVWPFESRPPIPVNPADFSPSDDLLLADVENHVK